MHFKKIISVFLTVLFLLSCMSVLSFADENLIESDLTQWTELWSSNPNFTSQGSGKYMVSFSNSSASNVYAYYKVSNADISISDTYELSFDVWGHFERVNCYVLASFNNQIQQLDGVELGKIYDDFASSGNAYTTFKTKFVPSNLYDGGISSFEVVLMFQIVNTSTTNLWFQNMQLVNVTDEAGFFQSIGDWFSKVYHAIVGGKDSSGNDHLGLAGDIGLRFTNIMNNVKNAITNAIAGIQQWFSDLGDRISDFFTMLKNYILYFQNPVIINSDGVPVDEYGEPIYENIFDIPDFFEKLEDWVDDLENARTDVQNGANQGVEKIRLTIAPLTSIISRVPFLTVFITFALAVIVIKKVIG